MVDAFVTVPPDSTGKNVGTTQRTHIDFDNQVNPIAIGDTITGIGSSSTGVITSIITEGFGANAGRLYLKPIFGATSVGDFNNNENLQISAVTVADADFTTVVQSTIHTQHTIVIDPDNPTYIQKVDEFGASVNTFAEGSPQFGPFGNMLQAEYTSVGDHSHIYGLNATDWWDVTATGGTITWVQDESSVKLSTTTTSGSKAQRTSDHYHTYRPGTGIQLTASGVLGDSGKTGLRRRWGYFDDDNGLFFQLAETTLSVVQRSNVTGSPVDTVIDQTDWNSNKLDGTDAEGFTLDLTKANIYWLDFQWLGSGRVRFGVFGPDGERKIAHTIKNANANNTVYMEIATLPVRIEQENTAGVVSTSELKFACFSVDIIGKPVQTKLNFSTTTTSILNIADTDGEVPIISLRSKTLFGSKPNRVHIQLHSIYVLNTGAQPALITITNDASLTAASFASVGTTTTAEVDVAATAISSGTVLSQLHIGPNVTEKIFFEENAYERTIPLGIHLSADGSTQAPFSVSGTTLTTGTASLSVVINWHEEQQ